MERLDASLGELRAWRAQGDALLKETLAALEALDGSIAALEAEAAARRRTNTALAAPASAQSAAPLDEHERIAHLRIAHAQRRGGMLQQISTGSPRRILKRTPAPSERAPIVPHTAELHRSAAHSQSKSATLALIGSGSARNLRAAANESSDRSGPRISRLAKLRSQKANVELRRAHLQAISGAGLDVAERKRLLLRPSSRKLLHPEATAEELNDALEPPAEEPPAAAPQLPPPHNAGIYHQDAVAAAAVQLASLSQWELVLDDEDPTGASFFYYNAGTDQSSYEPPPELNAVATAMQALFRGAKARKEFRSGPKPAAKRAKPALQDANDWELCEDDDEPGTWYYYNVESGASTFDPPAELDALATTMQARFRGAKARKEAKARPSPSSATYNLGSNWEQCVDDDDGSFYYFNTATEVSSYDPPAEGVCVLAW